MRLFRRRNGRKEREEAKRRAERAEAERRAAERRTQYVRRRAEQLNLSDEEFVARVAEFFRTMAT